MLMFAVPWSVEVRNFTPLYMPNLSSKEGSCSCVFLHFIICLSFYIRVNTKKNSALYFVWSGSVLPKILVGFTLLLKTILIDCVTKL